MAFVIKIRPLVQTIVYLTSVLIVTFTLWQANIHILRTDPALVPFFGILFGLGLGFSLIKSYGL